MKIWFILCNGLLILSDMLFVITRYQAYLSLKATKQKQAGGIGLIFTIVCTAALISLNVLAGLLVKDLTYVSLLTLVVSMGLWFTSSLWMPSDVIAKKRRTLSLLANIVFIGGMLLSFVLLFFVIMSQKG